MHLCPHRSLAGLHLVHYFSFQSNSDQNFTKKDTQHGCCNRQNQTSISSSLYSGTTPLFHECRNIVCTVKIKTERNRLQMNSVNQHPYDAPTTMIHGGDGVIVVIFQCLMSANSSLMAKKLSFGLIRPKNQQWYSFWHSPIRETFVAHVPSCMQLVAAIKFKISTYSQN